MNRFPILASYFVAWAMLVVGVGAAAAQTDASPDKIHRKIFVPFESLDVLLDGNSNRVLLDRESYERLLDAAHTREITRAPMDSVILSANYVGTVDEGVARIRGELIIEPLNEGLVQIPLPFRGVAISSARIGDDAAKLWRNDKGEIVLLTSDASRQTLIVEMTVPMETTAARQSLSIGLPSPSATQFSLTVPGNVEVKSGASVMDRSYDDEADRTSFRLLPSRGPMNIVMSLNNRLLKDDQIIVSRSVMIHKLTPDVQEMHVTCSLDVIHGALEEIEFALPEGFEVSQVSSKWLSQWEIKEPSADDREVGRRLVVRLRQPTREDVVLSITAIRSSGVDGEWRANDIRPIGVAGRVSVVGVLADEGLSCFNLESDGVIPIDQAFLLAAMPDSINQHATQSPVRVVAAFYAPQKDYSISARFVAPPAELTVRSSSRLVIDDQQLQLQGGVSLISRYDARFDVVMLFPKSWRLTELTDIDNRPLRFDRLRGPDHSRFLVHLPSKIPSDKAMKLFFKASLTPEGWLESWSSNEVNFPTVTIEGETLHAGTIAVMANDDLAAKPTAISGLELLDAEAKKKYQFDRDLASLAYQFDAPGFELSLALQRLKPSMSARTYNFFSIAPSGLGVHAELVFDIQQARESEFQFELPLTTPKSISIRCHDQVLKDYHSEDTETARRWTVQLANPSLDVVHLLVDFQMPMDESDLEQMELAPVVVRNVSFQSSMVVVEGSNELDIQIETEARSVDVGELSESIYQPGRHMLGAYAWPNENMELAVSTSRRPIYSLPSAIVQRAEMVTALSTKGVVQTAARFQLVVKQQPFLRIELPPESTLWSVLLDGQPAKPQRRGDSLVISLIGNEAGKLRDLQIVFESPAETIQLMGDVQAQAPTLWLNETIDGAGVEVPVVDLHWRLLLPKGYTVSRCDGGFQSDQLMHQPSLMEQFGNWVYWLGGGVGNVYAVREAFVREASDAPMSMAAPNEKFLFDRSEGMDDADYLFSIIDGDAALMVNGKGLATRSGKFSGLSSIGGIALPATPGGPGGGIAPAPNQLSRPAKPAQSDAGKRWALSGLRSLNIELTDTGNSIELYSLGEQHLLSATIVNQTRMNWIAVGLSLLLATLGVLLTNGKIKSKLWFLTLVFSVACLAPIFGSALGGFRSVVDIVILSVVLLMFYYVVAWLIQQLRKSVALIGARLNLALLLICFAIGFAEPSFGQQVVKDEDEIRRLLQELKPAPKVVLPDDAIIIPFDSDDPKGRANAARMLVPYEHYLQLLGKSETGDAGIANRGPVNYVVAAAEYELELSIEGDVSIKGSLIIELFTDEPTTVPLAFRGGALSNATVDGQPAKLRFAAPAGNAPNMLEHQANQSSGSMQQEEPSSMVDLHLVGRGARKFEFVVQIKPQRQGGWRMINVRMPVGVTRGLTLRSLNEAAEIRINADADRRNIVSKPGQEIQTVMNADGTLRLQWRPSTATQVVDQSLTAKSEAVFDVREDGLRLMWHVGLDFRGSERDSFTLLVPADYLVEEVAGDNIRAWDVRQVDGESRLDVTLLGTAKDSEAFTIELTRRDFSVGEETRQLTAPYLTVAGAALHQGVYTIRHSPVIELKTDRQSGASRIDESPDTIEIGMDQLDLDSSPLGIESFQVMRFVTTPFEISLAATLVPKTLKAQTQTVFRLGQSVADLEMKINLRVGKRPIYHLRFELPRRVKIKRLAAGLQETWTTEDAGNLQRVDVFFPQGVSADFSVILIADLTEFAGGDEWTIPNIKIDSVLEQSGQIAIQVDPAVRVTTADLKNCEMVLLRKIEPWLNPDQRAMTRLAITSQGSDYSATLRFSNIEPRVTVETVTNVRTTLFAVEETILLDFNIQQAGISELQFEIPATMRGARINASWVSETLIEDVADDPSRVRVTLKLQDDVIGAYRVVVENDRQLADGRQRVPVPHVLTGTTENQYATLQNAGRDEIDVVPTEEFQKLNRQLAEFARLKQKMGDGELTLAFVADATNASPELLFEFNRREIFETVAASIEFSKTTMVVDAGGAYRALQSFQVNNRSEQYLEIELPENARLLTVLVEGKPVKPVAWPAAQNSRRLRIPLVKNSLGDLDYPVQLKFAGTLGPLANFQEVGFPVIETLNINVQLSQLHLRLPESFRWTSFGGTMTRVDSQGELEEGYLSYKSHQIQQLVEQIQSDSWDIGSFSRTRAYGNLKRLEADMETYDYAGENSSDRANRDLQGLIEVNKGAIRQAQDKFAVESLQKGKVDNRANINDFSANQTARISRNSVTRLDLNFQVDEIEKRGELAKGAETKFGGGLNAMGEGKSGKDSSQEFDQAWFLKNQLGQQQSGQKRKEDGVQGIANSPERGFGMRGKNLPAPQSFSDAPSRYVDDSVAFFNPEDITKKEELKRRKLAKGSKKKGNRNRDASSDPSSRISDEFRATLNDSESMGMLFMKEERSESGEQGKFGFDGENKPANLRPGGLTSLEIEMPDRGMDYFFKSPRGNASVTARPVAVGPISRWISGAIGIGLCFFAWIAFRVAMRMGKNSVVRYTVVTGLLLGGLLSVSTEFLPVYGLLAIAISLVFFFDALVRAACRPTSQ